MAKPMKTLELHYPMIQFLVKSNMFYCINLYLHVTKLEGKDQSTQKKKMVDTIGFCFPYFFQTLLHQIFSR